jgi:SAM-dependent methyltransferase
MASKKLYGKASLSPYQLKRMEFQLGDNEKDVTSQRKFATAYGTQPGRKLCKNCDKKLSISPDFQSVGIDYVICDFCSHLNGLHEDTDEFCQTVYGDPSLAEFYASQDTKSYKDRIENIYLPKAEFRVNVLRDDGTDPQSSGFLDVGCGSGYFIAALKRLGVIKVSGIELSKDQVDFGNSMIPGDPCLRTCSDENALLEEISKTRNRVVSMIHVLEHTKRPRELIKALRGNNHVEIIFFAIPLFSFSVYIGMLSEEIFHRQLHGGHTHLYTERSIRYIVKEFGFISMAEWWFGTDAIELYRFISLTLGRKNCSERLRNCFKQQFAPIVDQVQLTIDKEHFSSEVHMVLKKV